MHSKIKFIVSDKNTYVKELVSRKDGLFIFEGEKLVSDIINSGNIPDLLLMKESSTKEFKRFEKVCKNIWHVSEKVMKKISSLMSIPELIAVFEKLPENPDFFDTGIIFAMDNVQDPGNLGSVFRCAAAFGFRSLALTGSCVKLNNPKFLRTAQNSIFHISSKNFNSLDQFLKDSADQNFNIYLTSSHPREKTVDIKEVKLPAVIVIGNEGKGIKRKILDRYYNLVIPQSDIVESLNAGISACIMMNMISGDLGLLNISD